VIEINVLPDYPVSMDLCFFSSSLTLKLIEAKIINRSKKKT